MSSLDATLIRRTLAAKTTAQLDDLELFGSIASTNTYLLAQPAPEAGHFRVAIADHQTSGRGRHFRRWVSPPGAGLCLSLAYTFEEHPDELPSLTLAIGVGIIAALKNLGIEGISLKWPNDIVALDGKMGGILTEVQSGVSGGVTIVTGIGLNVDLSGSTEIGMESEWAQRAVDINSIVAAVPRREVIAAGVINTLHGVMRKFAALGFVGFAEDWAGYDWLRGREITVELPDRQVSGTAVGVNPGGALLVDTGNEQIPVVSGSITLKAS